MPFCRSEFMFENDVEMYGAQTLQMAFSEAPTFENDVEMYGAQTSVSVSNWCLWFENDVEMYGAQTIYKERVMQA